MRCALNWICNEPILRSKRVDRKISCGRKLLGLISGFLFIFSFFHSFISINYRCADRIYVHHTRYCVCKCFSHSIRVDFSSMSYYKTDQYHSQYFDDLFRVCVIFYDYTFPFGFSVTFYSIDILFKRLVITDSIDLSWCTHICAVATPSASIDRRPIDDQH